MTRGADELSDNVAVLRVLAGPRGADDIPDVAITPLRFGVGGLRLLAGIVRSQILINNYDDRASRLVASICRDY